MRSILLFLLIVSCNLLSAQTDTINILDAEQNRLAYIVDDKVISSHSGDILYTVKGNLIFKGESDERGDILYMIKSKDLFSRSKSQVFKGTSDTVLFTARKGGFYLGDSDTRQEEAMIAYMESSERIIVFKDFRDELIGFSNTKGMTNAELFMSFKFLSNKYSLEEITKARLDSLPDRQYTGEITGGMKARWSGGPGSDWVWDGRVFRPRNIPDIYYEWVYDGEIIKPRWQHHIYEEWIWDGRSLKPLWAQSPEYEYVWNGRLLKPYWPGDGRMEYIIEEGMASPYLGSPRGEEWIIYGDIPLPLVFIVVLGIAYR